MGKAGNPFGDEIPPRMWGKDPAPRGAPCREETGWPVGEMIVVVVVAAAAAVECYCFLLNNYC